MARPAKFSDDDLLDAALGAVGDHGRGATITHVTEVLQAPVGSVYYRFPSRDHLMVSLWLRTVGHFQRAILERTSEPGDPEVDLEWCARHVVSYCRSHPHEARALALYHQPVLVRECPPELADRVRTVNDAVSAAMEGLTRRRYGQATARRRALVTTAVQQGPYGLVRPYLGRVVPTYLDDVVTVSARAILGLGD